MIWYFVRRSVLVQGGGGFWSRVVISAVVRELERERKEAGMEREISVFYVYVYVTYVTFVTGWYYCKQNDMR